MTDPEGRTVGATYLRNNFDKRSVGIDLKLPEGRELFLALVPNFDVVAENFKAGTMDRMGLGYDVISQHASARDLRLDLRLRQHRGDAVPRLAGVRVDRRGDVGHLRLHDIPTSRRSRSRSARSATSAPRCSASSASWPRCATATAPGVGQYVDIAMFDAMVAMTDIVTNFWSLGVRPEPGKGLEVICEGFRASDGYVVVQIVREHQFGNLAELVGHPEWRDDPRFATPCRLGRRTSSR